MAINRDFNDLFCAFNARDVRYLVVGAHAVTFHARLLLDVECLAGPNLPSVLRHGAQSISCGYTL